MSGLNGGNLGSFYSAKPFRLPQRLECDAYRFAIAIQLPFARDDIGEVNRAPEDLFGKKIIQASHIVHQACGDGILDPAVRKGVMESGGDIEVGTGMDVCLKELLGANGVHELL